MKKGQFGQHRVLTVGPDIKAIGGIASVLASYKRNFSNFSYAPSNSRYGTIAGAFVLLWLLVKMPFYRLAGYDVVYVHSACGKSFIRKRIILTWAKVLGFKTVFHCHGAEFQTYAKSYGSERMSKFLGSLTAVAAIGEFWKRYFEQTMGCKNVTFVHNIIEPNPRLQSVSKKPGDKIKFLFIAHLTPRKGVFEIVEALGKLPKELLSKVQVTLAGPGDATALKERARALGVEEYIDFPGPVKGDSKEALLMDYDVMLLPSYNEGLPIGLLEAGLCGMPSITTPVGAIEELIVPGENGVLIPPGDVDALSEAMASYVRNPERISKEGAKARQGIKPYLPEAVYSDLLRLYESF